MSQSSQEDDNEFMFETIEDDDDDDDEDVLRIASSDLILLDLIESVESSLDDTSSRKSDAVNYLNLDYKMHLFTDKRQEKIAVDDAIRN